MADRRPTIKVQGTSLPKGSRKEFEEGRTAIAQAEEQAPDLEPPEPQVPAQAPASDEAPVLEEEPDDEEDDEFFDDPDQDLVDEGEDDVDFSPSGDEMFLFAPTDQPMDPITSGLPVGDGPDDIPLPGETHRETLLRVARRMKTMPGADRDLQNWVARLELGG